MQDATEKMARPTFPNQRGMGGLSFFAMGFGHRLVAALVDLAIVIPVWLILSKLAFVLTGIALPKTRISAPDYWLDLLVGAEPALLASVGILAGLSAVYLLLFQVTLAQTVGMRVMRMRIIDVYGDKPSVKRCMLRTAGYFINLATLCLGFFWMAFDTERRGLHDWLAGTHVVRDQ